MKRNPNPIDILVGSKLRHLRSEIGQDESGLGEILGVTAQQIKSYESGQSRLAASQLIQLCKYFNVTPGFFFSESNSTNFSGNADRLEASLRLNEIVSKIEDSRLIRQIIDFSIEITKKSHDMNAMNGVR